MFCWHPLPCPSLTPPLHQEQVRGVFLASTPSPLLHQEQLGGGHFIGTPSLTCPLHQEQVGGVFLASTLSLSTPSLAPRAREGHSLLVWLPSPLPHSKSELEGDLTSAPPPSLQEQAGGGSCCCHSCPCPALTPRVSQRGILFVLAPPPSLIIVIDSVEIPMYFLKSIKLVS